MRRPRWLIPLAAVLALVPMMAAGAWTGKDAVFHLSSWLGAADQMRHGMLWPRWDFLTAYNAGEPRFVFYPPMSWMTGALLSFVLPVGALPFVMAWICMVIAGFAMHGLARRYATADGAVLAACLYLTNPWMMFTILARSAYGELFAAAFCPWLLAAAMEDEAQVWRIALPLGLIWLSNIPGAILCTYLLAAVLMYRLVRERRVALVGVFGMGLAWALMLDAVAFLPALVQRKYIDVEGAFPEGFRPIDNLAFFRKTASDPFFRQTEWLGLGLFVVAVGLLLVKRTSVRPLLLMIAVGAAFSLTWFAKPLWSHLPAVWVVQFPWRVLFVMATVAALAAGMALARVPVRVTMVITVVMSVMAVWAFHVAPVPGETPAALQRAMLVERHTAVPTNEYVVLSGNSELMRPDSAPYWLTEDAQAFSPGSSPVSDFDPSKPMPAIAAERKLEATPMKFEVKAEKPEFLVVRLQDYPNWVMRVNDAVARRVVRDDGLVAVPVGAGVSRVEVRWRYSWDEWMGLGVSLGAFGLLTSPWGFRRKV